MRIKNIKESLILNWKYLVGGLIVLIIICLESQGEGDFLIFISASKDILLKKNIYEILYNDWFHYYYDTLFALLLVPFTFIKLYFAKFIWLCLNVFFVYRIWQIIILWLPLNTLNKSQNKLFTTLSFVFILGLMYANFHLSQLTIFILYLTLEGLHFIDDNETIKGSALLALGINIKLLPLVILPYLFYRHKWKAGIMTTGFVLMFLLIPSIFIGFEYNKFLLLERWHLINPLNAAHVLDTSERSFHSLSTLFSTLLVSDCGDYHALPLKRNIANISIKDLNVIINIARGVLILLTLFFLKTLPFKKSGSKIQKLYEISYLCLIVPLIFPHQQHYAFFFVFPATSYIMFYVVSKFTNTKKSMTNNHFKLKKTAFICTLIIIYFLLNSHFILGQFNDLYDHYKTLTYGVILLLITLLICNPNKISINSLNQIKKEFQG